MSGEARIKNQSCGFRAHALVPELPWRLWLSRTLRGLKPSPALALGGSRSCMELDCCLVDVCSCMCVICEHQYIPMYVCINITISLPLSLFSEDLYHVCFCQGYHPDLWVNIPSWFSVSDLRSTDILSSYFTLVLEFYGIPSWIFRLKRSVSPFCCLLAGLQPNQGQHSLFLLARVKPHSLFWPSKTFYCGTGCP